MSRVIIVTGATGNQGGAVVKSLLQSKSDFTILAVTRNAESPASQKLREKSSKVLLVQGDLNNTTALFANAKKLARSQGSDSIWGVYSVQAGYFLYKNVRALAHNRQNPLAGGQTVEMEIQQGKALIDESLKNNVKYFVYSSVDRGGDRSFENPTIVPHFASKHEIEQYLVSKTSDGNMDWTILRPTGFMENYVPGFQGKVALTAWKYGIAKGRRQQLVATSDIGYFAAEAFLKPDEYRCRAISIVGDELNFDEADKIFQQKTDQKIPTTFSFASSLLLCAVKDVGIMFKWFNHEGFGADLKELKKNHPGLTDFGTYIEKQSGFVIR